MNRLVDIILAILNFVAAGWVWIRWKVENHPLYYILTFTFFGILFLVLANMDR